MPKNKKSKPKVQTPHTKKIGREENSFYLPFWGWASLLLFFIYLIGVLITGAKKTDISAYQVMYGNNNNSTDYTAFIMREEKIVTSPMTGTMNYFTKNGERIGAGNIVCSMDKDGTFFNRLKDELDASQTSLDKSTLKDFHNILKSFNQSFDEGNYEDLYRGKYMLSSSLMGLINEQLFSQIANDTAGDKLFDTIISKEPGIILFNYDNMSHITAESITQSVLSGIDYSFTSIPAGSKIEEGAPLYRLVRSDAFSIIFLLSEEDKVKYFLNTSLTIRFVDEDITVTGKYSHYIGADGMRYGLVTFSGNGYSFLSKRYVKIQICDSMVEGLKIPSSAVVQKDYLAVPKQYVDVSSNSIDGKPQVLVYDPSGNHTQKTVTILSQTHDYYIIAPSSLKEGDMLIEIKKINDGIPDNPDHDVNSAPYPVTNKMAVNGVYYINRGYTQFRYISILEELEDGFMIIDVNAPNTIREYDWIALDGSKYEEGDLIY